jgi:hypothetical protein
VPLPDKPAIETLILKKLKAIKPEIQPGHELLLYAPGGALSSIELVMLIVDVEQDLRSTYKKDIVLASARAMSQKNSPFHSITSFTNFIFEELNS